MCFMVFISIDFENTKYLINRFVLQECGGFTWRVSECKELWALMQNYGFEENLTNFCKT